MAATLDDIQPPGPLRAAYRRLSRAMHDVMPTGLFARSLIIIIMPVLTLQTLIVFAFSERHWWEVTTQLSQGLVGDIASIVDIVATYPQDADFANVTRIAKERMGLAITVLPDQTLPEAGPKPFFDPLNGLISNQIGKQIGKPFFIDTGARQN